MIMSTLIQGARAVYRELLKVYNELTKQLILQSDHV